MGAPSVDYEMFVDGYKITSGTNGFRAQASFLVAWADAYTFHDDIMGFATATVVGPVTYNTPWQFPGSTSARLYASSCEISPFGLAGGAAPITLAKGMKPSEFWSHVRFDVTFETPSYAHSAADDPGNRNQVDPTNPIYHCEQSIRIGSRAETRTKESLKFLGSDVKLAEDVTIYKGESTITLTYPFVPFVPWKKYRPFVNSLNDATFLDCGIGELLFNGAQIQPAQGPGGILGNSLTLELLVNEYDWNKVPLPGSGVPTKIVNAEGTPTPPYSYKSFDDLLLG